MGVPNNIMIESIELELKDKYKDTPGVINVSLDGFLDDVIVITIDPSLFKENIPASFRGIPVIIFDVYESYKEMSKVVDSLIVNEPSLWDNKNHSSVENLFSLCDYYKKIISNYEKEKKYGRPNIQ